MNLILLVPRLGYIFRLEISVVNLLHTTTDGIVRVGGSCEVSIATIPRPAHFLDLPCKVLCVCEANLVVGSPSTATESHIIVIEAIILKQLRVK